MGTRLLNSVIRAYGVSYGKSMSTFGPNRAIARQALNMQAGSAVCHKGRALSDRGLGGPRGRTDADCHKSFVRRIRLYALFAAALGFVGCSSFPYEYVKLAGENVAVTKTGRPRVGYWPFSLDRIALRYVLTEPGVSLTISVDEDGGAPNLEVVSSVPIRAVSTGDGHVYPISSFKYIISWGLSEAPRIGDVIQISIDLDDRIGAVLISGVFADGGKIIDCACGL